MNVTNRSSTKQPKCNEATPELTERIVITAVYTLIALVIITGNSMALAVFLKKTFLVRKSHYFLVNLTIADLLVAGTVIMSIYAINFPEDYSQIGAKIARLLAIFPTASLYSLTVMAMERVYMIFRPFRHRQAKSSHYYLAIGVTWLIATIISSLSTVSYSTRKLAKLITLEMTFTFAIVVNCFCLFVMLISYTSIWIKLTFFKPLNNQRTRLQLNGVKLAKTLFIVTVVSLITWLPNQLDVAAFHITGAGWCIKHSSSRYISHSLGLLLFSNSFINIVVYSFRMPDFRRELTKMLCRKATHNHGDDLEVMRGGPSLIRMNRL